MKRCVADVDAGLVEALRRHDADGAGRLVERYGDRAYRLALCITGTKDDTEHALQEALQTVLDTIDTFTGESTFRAWIVRTVASTAYQTVRHRAQDVNEIAITDVVPVLDVEGRHFEAMEDWSSRIDEQALKGELGGSLIEAIEAQPAAHRIALILHDAEGVSKPDIAAILGVDVATVTLYVHRARLFLRKWVSAYFASADVARAP
jgi:RNA polymerase sigma-70 factor (ECF subfamily)